MSFAESLPILAQATADNPLLYAYGPLGIVCAFFMWRDVTRERERSEERTAFIIELRDLAHRLDGLTKALLVDMASRETCGVQTKQYASEAIAKIDARSTRDQEPHR